MPSKLCGVPRVETAEIHKALACMVTVVLVMLTEESYHNIGQTGIKAVEI